MDGRDWAVCFAGGFPMPWSWPFRENQPIPGGDQARSPAAGWPGFRGIRPGTIGIYIHLAVLYIYMVMISRDYLWNISCQFFLAHYEITIYIQCWHILGSMEIYGGTLLLHPHFKERPTGVECNQIQFVSIYTGACQNSNEFRRWWTVHVLSTPDISLTYLRQSVFCSFMRGIWCTDYSFSQATACQYAICNLMNDDECISRYLSSFIHFYYLLSSFVLVKAPFGSFWMKNMYPLVI